MMCGEEDFLFRKGSKVVLNARKKILNFLNVLKKLSACENFYEAIFAKLLTNGVFFDAFLVTV